MGFTAEGTQVPLIEALRPLEANLQIVVAQCH